MKGCCSFLKFLVSLKEEKRKQEKRNKGIDEEMRIDFKHCPICFNG